MIAKTTAKTFERNVLKSRKPVVVDVWAPWCKPCQAMEPNVKAAARQFKGQADFYKLNADENKDVLSEYKVMGIPTMLYFRHGKLVDKKTGLQTEESIAKRLSPLLEMSSEDAAKKEIKGWFRPSVVRALGGIAALAAVGAGVWFFVL